jgi:hypothetical protein
MMCLEDEMHSHMEGTIKVYNFDVGAWVNLIMLPIFLSLV